MPVLLITSKERLEWKHEDTETSLYYRRPTTHFQRELQAKHTKKGITDDNAVVAELIEWAILGWDGVIGSDGEPVEFDKELIRNLPELYKAQFITALYELNPKLAQLGN